MAVLPCDDIGGIMEDIHNLINKNIGLALREARLKKNISLDKLSYLLGGLKTKSTLKRYEDGNSKIDTTTLISICNVLGVDAEELMYTSFHVGEKALNDNANNLFAKRLKKCRIKNELSQRQLADLLSLSSSTIGMYENAAREPNIDIILNLCNILRVDANYLLGYENGIDSNLSLFEQALISKYRSLSNYDRETIELMVDRLYSGGNDK